MKRKVQILTAACLLAIAASCRTVSSDTESARAAVIRQIAHSAAKALSENDIEAYMGFLTDDFTHESVNFISTDNKDDFSKKIESRFTADPGIINFQKNVLIDGESAIYDECTFITHREGPDAVNILYHMDIVEFSGNQMSMKRSYGDKSAFAVMSGWQPPPFEAPPEVVSDKPPRPFAFPASPERKLKLLYKRWSKRNVRAIIRMFDEDASVRIAIYYSDADRASFSAWLERFFTVFPDTQMSEVRTLGGKGWAGGEFRLTGTQNSSYAGYESLGNSFDLNGGIIIRTSERGLIKELKLFIDGKLFIRLLGYNP